MGILRVDWSPPPGVMRTFGASMLLVGLLCAGVCWLLPATGATLWVLTCAAGGTGSLALLMPRGRVGRALYRVWTAPAFVVGSVISVLLVTIAYYLLITPLALALRLFRRRPPSENWAAAPEATDVETAFLQF